MTPFFQASRCSLAYQFTINVPLMCPPFSTFRKNLHFQPCFWPKFQLSRGKHFWIFAPKTLIFQGKTRSLDPTFGNARGTYSPKNSWVPPPPPGSWSDWEERGKHFAWGDNKPRFDLVLVVKPAISSSKVISGHSYWLINIIMFSLSTNLQVNISFPKKQWSGTWDHVIYQGDY